MNKDKFTNDTTSVKSQSVPIKLASGDAPSSGNGTDKSGPKPSGSKEGNSSNGDKSKNDEGKRKKD